MEDDSQLQDCGITNAVAKAQLPSEVGLAFRYYRIQIDYVLVLDTQNSYPFPISTM